MNIEQVREYTLSLAGVTEDQAFGEDILNFRLEGKIFVCLWLGDGRYYILPTLAIYKFTKEHKTESK